MQALLSECDECENVARTEPDPSWIRGKCPDCGGPVVHNAYYVGGKGYQITAECWNSLGWDEATCQYRKVL